MRAGRLRHLIDFYQDDADSETIDPDWVVVDKLKNWPADVVQLSAQETAARLRDQIEVTATHQVTTRYHADITEALQLVDHLGRTHAISQVIDNDGRQRSLTLQTTVVT